MALPTVWGWDGRGENGVKCYKSGQMCAYVLRTVKDFCMRSFAIGFHSCFEIFVVMVDGRNN